MRLLRSLLNLFMIPIHEYDGAFPVGTCKFCGHGTGLSGWQLVDMPKSMAYCPGGKLSFRFRDSFNCREKLRVKKIDQSSNSHRS